MVTRQWASVILHHTVSFQYYFPCWYPVFLLVSWLFLQTWNQFLKNSWKPFLLQIEDVLVFPLRSNLLLFVFQCCWPSICGGRVARIGMGFDHRCPSLYSSDIIFEVLMSVFPLFKIWLLLFLGINFCVV